MTEVSDEALCLPAGASSSSSSSSSALPLPPPNSSLRSRMSSKTLPMAAADIQPSLPSRRRSSLLSFSSLDGTRQSAGDFIRPGLSLDDDDDAVNLDEASHWNSSPLAFAVLPAVAGLFFTNGSAFVTDMILLALAALFLNWSVRLPWDWYRSAQAQFSLDQLPPQGLDDDGQPQTATTSPHQDQAAASLRQHEVMALISTFVFPACAAYLLHVIRSQLSRPSEGLISDYNLTIFLLAAEIRPVRQLIRLFTHRTVHLQRIVRTTVDPKASKTKDKTVADLQARLLLLENKLVSSPSAAAPSTQKDDVAALAGEIRKRYEPRLDALERAVRRYEKRVTTLTLLTEQRMQSLENRLQDALSLAAVAAQSSTKPGILTTMLSTLAKTLAVPIEFAWLLFVWPLKITESVLKKAGLLVLGPSTPPRHRVDSKGPKPRSDKKREDSHFAKQY